MARGDNQGNRGGRGGFRGGGPRGGFRGRGGGSVDRGRGRGIPGSSIFAEELEFNAKMYANDLNTTESAPTRRGRGRGTYTPHLGKQSNPNSGANTPQRGGGRGRGWDAGRGQNSPASGRGRGFGRGDSSGRRGSYGIGASPRGRGGGNRFGADPNGSLSSLLHRERPLLRPVIFVPAVHNRLLFCGEDGEDNDELLKPAVEDVSADSSEFRSHAPTADRVSRVFSGGIQARQMDLSSDEEGGKRGEQEIEEIDFNDMERLLRSLEQETLKETKRSADTPVAMQVVEERFTGFIDINRTPTDTSSSIPHENAQGAHMESVEPDFRTISGDGGAMQGIDDDPSTHGPIAMDAVPTDHETHIPTGQQEPIGPASAPEALVIDDAEPTTPTTAGEHLTSPVPTPMEGISQAPSSALVEEGGIALSADVELAPPSFFIDTEPSPPLEGSLRLPRVPAPPPLFDDEEIIVYVAPHPRKSELISKVQTEATVKTEFAPYIRAAGLPSSSITERVTLPQAEGSSSSSVQPQLQPTTSLSTLAFSFSQTNSAPGTPSRRLQVPPISTPRMSKAAKAKQHKQARRLKKQGGPKSGGFGSFGAMMQERELRGGSDPRWKDRRRGDSDLDWGDEEGAGEDGDGSDEELTLAELIAGAGVANGNAKSNGKRRDKGKGKAKELWDTAEGMDLDPELELDSRTLRAFVGGMLGRDGGSFVTMDDIKDAEMMRLEDEEGEEGHSSGWEDEDEGDEDEIDKIIALEEAMVISEPVGVSDGEHEGGSDDDEDDDDTSDDEEETPRTSFQARLERLRKQSQNQKAKDDSFGDASDDEDESDFFHRNMTWAEKDDDYLSYMQDILDDNADLLTSKDRKTRKKLFNAIRDGDFEDLDAFNKTRRKEDDMSHLPPALQEQWKSDRAKKAEYKKQRELEKLIRAADPLEQKKGGRKGRKAMKAAARLDPTITVLPNRIIDMTTLVQQIRRFIADIGGPSTMSLPPTAKETRKNVHELAIAFGLKSQSKGKGDSRYTTLSKTSKSVEGRSDEAKIGRIVRRSGGAGARGDDFSGGFGPGKGKGKGVVVVPRHKEGEEVGKAAPRIGASNVGFRMLAMMGWSEGNRIGATGGLEAPVTAIIKHSKLGLGATR